MNTSKTLLLSLPLLALMAACNSEETNKPTPQPNQKPDLTGLTEFAVTDTATRTAGAYNGSGLDFFWTAEDKIWVTDDDGTIQQSNFDDIQDRITPTNPTTAKAKFFLNGNFGASNTYKVRYTGKNGLKDKVTIAASQLQTTPNKASHIGESGDCGIATAMPPSGGGRYQFALNHAAAYLTLMPYNSTGALGGPMTQIKVTADKAICGQFDFNDNGIDLDSRPAATPANQSITLDLRSSQPRQGFGIPIALTPATNASTIVLAPGTYSTFTVEITFYNGIRQAFVTYKKTYKNLVFTAGKNKALKTDFKAQRYQFPAHYHNGSDSRINGYPNMNEIIWYVIEGAPYWDESKLFLINNTRLYCGGMWVKKQSVIAAEQHKSISALRAAAPDGHNYYVDSNGYGWAGWYTLGWPPFSNTSVTMGEPLNTNDYFFLPALGESAGGTTIYALHGPGEYAELYSSTHSEKNQYYMICRNSVLYCRNANRYWLFQTWPAAR